jgi:RHS repeat-associated protein
MRTLTIGTGAKSGTRYYTFNGQTLAEGTDLNTSQYLVGDQHGTNQIAVNAQTYSVTRRAFDPYGNARGTGIGNWPDAHGFLNKPTDSDTGLTDIGARKYDALIGRFISVDPVLESTDPGQMSGYAYAANDPINASDPTSLRIVACLDTCGAGESIQKSSGANNAVPPSNANPYYPPAGPHTSLPPGKVPNTSSPQPASSKAIAFLPPE